MSERDQPAQPPTETLSPLKRAFLALEQAQARIATLEQAAREPIAIIGLGCRVPGADDPAAFWQLMRDGRDVIGPIPSARWDVDAHYDPDPNAPGRIATRAGGFLRAIDEFDPELFGIAPREAQGMDPQQRLFLEVAWEALESAGQAPDRLERSKTGVYVGVCNSDYTHLQLGTKDPHLLDAHFTSGIAHSIASGRLSYLLGLQGPSLTIDTACSSSLVAVHLACQALRSGDCRMALAGGVNLILSPEMYIALSHSRMLAPDGRCKTFSASADGFGRGEGCGAVVLKRLSDARADGDTILAVIRGTAVNQDGPSGGLTAPNGPAQEAVIREALSRAGIAARDVGFVEAHGTGTELGDPLEVQALGSVFDDREPNAPLLIGSVKTNIGHLESAAGITGLIKVVLALRHRQIPAHLHFETPSPHIPWADLPLRVPTTATPWEPIRGRRIAGVSSFGFSGTNAHVVLEEAPSVELPRRSAAPRTHLFTLSAFDERSLAELAGRHAAALEGRSDEDLADICFTANTGRARFAERAAIVATSVGELRERLLGLASGAPTTGVKVGRARSRDPLKIAFVFTGQGAQYGTMAKGLYASSPVFRAALDRCAELVAPHLEEPLLDVVFSEATPSPVDRTAYTQPALFAVEYALTELWRSWGITPNAVIGHSVGEYVAACVAGVLELPDALRAIAARGRLMQSLPAGGTMAAISAPEERVAAEIASHPRVSIAAVNAPLQTVIAGSSAEVDAICAALTSEGVRCKTLKVSHAFHSPLVEPILDAFEAEMKSVRLSAPHIRLVSNVTGRVAEASEITQPSYWRRHVRKAVRFGDGLAALAAMKVDCVIEIGPHPTLLPFFETAFGDGVLGLASLRRGQPDWDQMIDALGALFVAGGDPNLRELGEGRITDLPTYPFQRRRYWFAARPSRSRVQRKGHPLLGTRLRAATAQRVYESAIGAETPSWLSAHRVLDHIVMPATAYLETLLAAAQDALRSELVQVENVTVKEAMLFDDDGAQRAVQVVCAPLNDGEIEASIHSIADGDDSEAWTTHVTARLRIGAPPAAAQPSLANIRGRCRATKTPNEHYAGFERRGLAFGEHFRTVRGLWHAEREALGEIALSDDLARDVAHYRIHPALLDGCLQVLDVAISGESASSEALYLPIAIGRFTLYGNPGARCFGHVVVRAGGDDTRTADVRVFDAQGKPIADLAEVELKRASRDALERMGDRWLDECLYETSWRPAPLAASATEPSALAHAANDKVDDLRSSSGVDAYDGFHEQLEALCGTYVVQAMRRLGWNPAVGESIEPDALAQKLDVQPRHGQLFARLLAILAEDGWLSREGTSFRVMRPLASEQPDHASVVAECPAASDEVELTARLGAKLAEALRGAVDPMELLFGDPSRFERIYRDTPTARFWNGLMAEALAAVPSGGRPLRILEVGGGTGATTSHVLPRLDGVEYTFTDVGPLFVERARERFGQAHSSMRFQTLDLERAPDAQGLAKHSFDIVIASNVIHATKDLRATLAKIRGLLVPGGLLAMLEVTAPQRWFDLTVGFTEGWWAFRDRDLRTDYATLPRDRWLGLLAESGFEAPTAIPAARPRGVLALQSIFLARSVRQATDWVLFADRGGVMTALAAKLRARGDRVTLVEPASIFAVTADDATVDVGSPDQVKRLFAELRARGRTVQGVVHACSIDAVEADGLSAVTSCLHVAQALAGEEEPPRLWLVTRGGQQAEAKETSLAPGAATVWGLGKAIGLEHPELRCACIDLEDAPEVDALLHELDASDAEPQIALRRAGRKVARLARPQRAIPRTRPSTYRLATTTPGALEGLDLLPLERRAPGPGEIEIAVEATGLNFKDTLNVLGMYPGDPGPLGGECAGRVTAIGPDVTHLHVGDDVLAVAGGSFASHVVARADFAQRRPPAMSAEEGASIPIAFLTAEFCLNHLAKMKHGERVLIHAAAGGVGMAAVRLAQKAGAEIFATAGSPWKRELLRDMGVDHVLDSRSTSFADEILARTDGKGVDVVLNSLADELIDASFRALARGGRFVEMGKRGIKTSAWVAAQERDLAYFVVDWGQTAEQDPALIAGMLARLMTELGRTDGAALTPLPRHVFSIDDAERAFRFMAQARHAGKVVVRHAEARAGIPIIRRDGTYLVTGGLAGIGLTVARWLAERGAGKIALVSRRGVTDAALPILEELRRHGSTVVAEAVDVADETAVRALLDRLRREGPPIRGVIHGAGVLDNAALLRQDAATFARVFAPKVRGALILDALTRTDPLDVFVLFSSVAAVLGARGQANHSAANAFLDLLARHRQTMGLPGSSIDWGAWTDAGAAADPEVSARLAAQGLGMLKPAQGIAALERLLGAPSPQVAVLPIDWPRYLQTQPPSPFFSDLANRTVTSQAPAAATAKASPRTFDLQKQLAAVPKGRWRPMVTSFVRERALKTLGLDPARAIDPRTPLGDLGLDSLLAVELRNTLSGAFGKSLPASLLFDYPTIEKLSEHILSSVLDVVDDAPVPAQEPTTVDATKGEAIVDSIEELSDEEVERQLAARGARVRGNDGEGDEDVR